MKYLILTLFSIFTSPCQMEKDYSIKLIGSNLQYAGQVQININGSQWASVCDAGWDLNDARVVCRQLNYVAAEAAILGEAFGHAPGKVVAKMFYCHGDERTLSKCLTYNSAEIRCRKNRVAAVLCKPNGILPVIIMLSMVGCLALTSIIILVVTCKTTCVRKKRCPATESEIVVSNANIKEDIESGSAAVGERELNESGNTFSSNSFSDFEEVENLPCPIKSVNTAHDKKEITGSTSKVELIEFLDSLEANRDIDEEMVKRKESRKGRYMPLLKGSRAFRHFYEKLLKRNRNRQSATDIDFAQDYYSSDQYSKDWPSKNDITDVDNNSYGEYHEIDSEEEHGQEKVDKDKDGSGYVPMLSLSHMLPREVAIKEEMQQDEYLVILPPSALSEEKNSPVSSKRESDYLHPVETDLPAFPEASDDKASCSYNEELPEPPKELATLTNDHQDDEKRKSPSGLLGLNNQGCRCQKEKDLVCKNCLDIHFIVKQKIVDQKQISRINLRDDEEVESYEDFEYVPMDHCSGEKVGTAAEEKVRRNSADYAIPMKKLPKNKEDHGSFPEELNKRLVNRKIENDTLSRSWDKGLIPNRREAFNPTVKREETTQEKAAYQGLPSPRKAGKAIENEKLSKEKSGNLEKTIKPNVSPTPSFSKTKCFFEKNDTIAGSLDTTKKAAFSKKLFKSEENESRISIPTSNIAGKPRSESCPIIEGTNGSKPSTSFLEALENALKSSGSRDETEDYSSGQITQKEIEIEMEHEYELDYEDINESKYENNDDIYSESRPGSDEYDYVHEKQRKSLHFYEAVSKNSVESEEDQYENI